jgi:hypothetical protein
MGESGFSPIPTEAQSPEHERSLDLKNKLRKWLPRMALVALPLLGCGREQQQAQEDMKQISNDAHAPHPSEVQSSTSRVNWNEISGHQTLSSVPTSVKILLDKAFASPTSVEESMVVFAIPKPKDGEPIAPDLQDALVASPQHHVHLHGDHPHRTSGRTDLDSPHEDLSASENGDQAMDDHPHGLRDHIGHEDELQSHPHPDKEHTDSSSRKGHTHDHGASHFEVFQGGSLPNQTGEAIREVLDLHGHVEIPVLTENGLVVIGMAKQSEVTSGAADQHAEAIVKLNQALYAALDLGGEIEVGMEGAPQFKLSLSAPATEQLELWGAVRSHGEHHHRDHGDSGEHEKEHSASHLLAIADNLDLGWRIKTGPASITAGIEEGEAVGKVSVALPLEGGRVLMAHLLLTPGSKHPGAFVKLTGNF